MTEGEAFLIRGKVNGSPITVEVTVVADTVEEARHIRDMARDLFSQNISMEDEMT